MISYNISVLKKIITIINNLNEDLWIQKISTINNETIGRHIRHIIDFYVSFFDGINEGLINYDNRNRNIEFEKNIKLAYNKIIDIINQLKYFEPNDKVVNVIINHSIYGNRMQSTINRELMNLIDHSIHHGVIINLVLNTNFKYLNINEKFYSPSTIEHLKK